jgi:hypothetical protein
MVIESVHTPVDGVFIDYRYGFGSGYDETDGESTEGNEKNLTGFINLIVLIDLQAPDIISQVAKGKKGLKWRQHAWSRA